jgi:hypothetical protein
VVQTGPIPDKTDLGEFLTPRRIYFQGGRANISHLAPRAKIPARMSEWQGVGLC